MRRHFAGGTAGAIMLLVGGGAAAQDQGGWRYTIAPYLWASSLAGEVGAFENAPSTDIDASFADLFDQLKFASMVFANANNGRFGISGDLQYYKFFLSDDVPAAAFDRAKLDTEMTVVSLVGEYLAYGSAESELWLAGGARYWDVSNDLTLTEGAAPQAEFDGSDSWTDPIIGLRGRTALGARTFATGWALGGGFGAGSDRMVDVFGGLGYAFTPTTSGIAGYRYLAVDRDEDDFVYDVEQQGLLLGLSFRF